MEEYPSMEQAMNLSTDQFKAVEAGQPVPIILEGTECVVLRKDVYERVKGIVQAASGEHTAGISTRL